MLGDATTSKKCFEIVKHDTDGNSTTLKVEKSRTRIVDFDSSSDEEKEEEGVKRDNSEWRDEVK